MVDAVLRELGAIVLCFVQANHVGHPEMPKHLQVVFRLVASTIGSDLVNGTHEGDELVWDDPVQVSVLDLLVVLILFVVELAEVVPAVPDCYFETFEAVENATAVGAITVARISEWSKASLIWGKCLPSHLCRLAQDDHHERPHQVSCIGLLIKNI